MFRMQWMILSNNNNCIKSNINGCKRCNNNSGICKECKLYYFPVYDNDIISKCNLLCYLGENEKSLTCEINKDKYQQCSVVIQDIN